MDKYRYSDADIDAIAREVHVHSYTETMESRRRDAFGNQIREFKCVTCGRIRSATVRDKKMETENGE